MNPVPTPAPMAAARNTIALGGMRAAIARSMETGWRIPRVAQSIEVDVTAVEALRVPAGQPAALFLTALQRRLETTEGL